MSEVSPQARLRWLEQLASDFPGAPAINMTLVWENDHGSAGVYSFPRESYVFLHDAQQSVESLAEAVSILRGIFANEIVAVNAYAGEHHVYCGLAPASDPSGGLNVLDKPGGGNMPSIDYVTTANWSSGLIDND